MFDLMTMARIIETVGGEWVLEIVHCMPDERERYASEGWRRLDEMHIDRSPGYAAYFDMGMKRLFSAFKEEMGSAVKYTQASQVD